MAYCGPRGIPYEVWMGTATGWTEFSRGAALAWQDREARRCGSCGQVEEDWLGDDGQELRTPPFDVHEAFCHGCESLHLHREDKGRGKERPPYLHPRFVPVPPPASTDGDPSSGTVTR